MSAATPIRDAGLDALGVDHGFGVRGGPIPTGLVRPTQIHGAVVAEADASGACTPVEADAIVARRPGVRVGIVTADCVPVLVSDDRGHCVAAIHAGWRGLAAGVIPAALAAMRGRPEALLAVVGPHIGPCCYEVDAPVFEAFRERFEALDPTAMGRGFQPARPGRWMLDLASFATGELERAGLSSGRIRVVPASCTRCDAERFESVRRDGASAGRLVHTISTRSGRD